VRRVYFYTVANEPQSPIPSSTDASAPQRHVRTFAQDVARLSGKPMPAMPARAVSAPVKSVVVPPPQPAPEPVVEPSIPQAAYEPPPGYVIPKAPTTDESREDVLARLKRKVQEDQVQETLIMPKAPSTSESREAVLARLKANVGVSAAEAVAPVATATPVPDRIHTYKSDFAEHIDEKDATAFSVIAAEADAQGTIQTVVFKERRPFPTAIVAGFLLIILGGSGLYAAYHIVTNRPMTVFQPRVPSLIVADERQELTGSGQELLTNLAAAASEILPEGTVRVTYTTTASTSPDGMVSALPQSGGALIAALALPMPDILLRSIQPESTVGIIRAGEEQRPFFILRVDSFERSFAGMLAWEAGIASDLSDLYPEYPAQEPVGTSTASTTPVVTVNTSFVDEVFGNRDARTLRDSLGRPIVVYGFHDKETLIIARDEAAYLALIERLSVSQGQ